MLKTHTKRILITGLFTVFILLPFSSLLEAEQQSSPGKSHGEDAFPINWKRYYSHDELTDLYRRMVKKFPDLVKLVSTGKSRQGRDLWLLEITNFKTGPAESKPALYIDGAIHGNEVQGIMCALYSTWYLLTHYGNDRFVTDLMDTRTFYIKPTVNVDAAHSFVTEPNTMHHPRWNYRPVDNDGDGKFDEDPEEDINGDGEISLMRRRNPNGRWKVGEDPRLLVRCEQDEPPGGWELLGYEGLDNDGDGLVNEDILGGMDLARNFPARWSISAGYPYPLSEPETRSTADYLLEHRNVGAIVHHHNMGQLIMIAAGPYQRREAERSPFSRIGRYPTEVDKKMERLRSVQVPSERRADWQKYVTLARRGVEITNYTPVPGGGMGQFSAWGYEHFGAFTFLVELWNIPADFNEDGIVDQGEMLRWVDREFRGEGWVEWKPFKHPTYGDIEIGGTFTKFVRRATPGKYLEQLAMKMNDWSLYIAYNLPLIKISSLKISPLATVSKAFTGKVDRQEQDFVVKTEKSLGKGLLAWVDIDITNERLLPTKSLMAHTLKLLPKDTLTLSGKHCEVLGYSELDKNLRPQKFQKKKKAEFDWIDGYETKRIRLLVRVKQSSPLILIAEFKSARGGKATKQVSLILD
ncbi:MAG: M14 family metallopeptidase [Candidatus Aminicenantaceae bacterium]